MAAGEGSREDANEEKNEEAVAAARKMRKN
jgi:hypothetical protein